jgi:hypothetical protein
MKALDDSWVLLINKAKITQRDRFFLLFLVILARLIESIALLIFIKQFPDLLEWVVTEILKVL